MRRSTREVTGTENIAAMLDNLQVCRLGFCDGDMPYVVPMNFGYEMQDGKFVIYCHGATEGRKLDIIAKNPNVCFEADNMIKLIEAEEACGWSAYYESVIGSGRAEIVTDEAGKAHGLELVMARSGYQGTPKFPAAMLARTAVIRLTLDEISAKRHDEQQ